MAAILPVLLLLMLWWVDGIKAIITILLLLAFYSLPERAAVAAIAVAGVVIVASTGC